MCGEWVSEWVLSPKLKFTFHLLNVNFSILFILCTHVLQTYLMNTCIANWFCIRLYSKQVIGQLVMSVPVHSLNCNVCPCTFLSIVMSVPVHSSQFQCLSLYIPLNCNVCLCTFLSIVVSVPCTFIKLFKNKFTVQLYTKPVYSITVHKISLQYSSTENQFTVQLYTKSVYSTEIPKTSLQYRSEIHNILRTFLCENCFHIDCTQNAKAPL